MDPTSVNSFLDQFLAVADSGFGLIQGDVSYVLNALIVISITLAGAQWALGGEAPMAPFFRKVLFVGLFAFLVNNWNTLATAINQSGAMLGLKAGGGAMTMAELHNPGRVGQIGIELFGRTVALARGHEPLHRLRAVGDDLRRRLLRDARLLRPGAAALRLADRVQARRAGRIRGPAVGRFQRHRVGRRTPARLGRRLRDPAFRPRVRRLRSRSPSSNTLPATFTLDAGGALNVCFFGLTVLALAWFAPMLASEVVQGQPHLSGADAVRTGVGAQASLPSAAACVASGAGRGALGSAAWRRRACRRGGGTRAAAAAAEAAAVAPAQINYAAMQPRHSRPPAPSSGSEVHELAVSERPRAHSPREPPDTPYQRARQEWDARMGSAVLSARAWRMIAFAALAACGVLGVALARRRPAAAHLRARRRSRAPKAR